MIKIYGPFLVLALLLSGCSSTYTIKDYSSKDRFYRDFNRSAKNKDLNITLLNDSLEQTTDGAVIMNDTLYTSTNIFPINNIKTVKYNNITKPIILGILAGGIIGSLISLPIMKNNPGHSLLDPFIYAIIITSAGEALGGAVGWYIGWDVTYKFNY
jgi:hypothetical protein